MKARSLEWSLAPHEERSRRLKQLATLATRLQLTDVTAISPDSHNCHTCHKYNENSVEKIAVMPLRGVNAVWNWLSIVAKEGHIEPSQPCVGKVIGWPARGIPARSLWVDFVCWCDKNFITLEHRPFEPDFHQVLSELFSRHGDHYEISDLATFRERYSQSRPRCERD